MEEKKSTTMSKRKKVFVLAGMITLLVVTGVLNIVLNATAQPADDVGGDITYQNLFATYRADRTSTRQQTISILDSIINSTTASAEAKLEAEASKLQITTNMELETRLEGLIKAIGFEDAFVTNSTENVNVIIKQEVLTDNEANKVLEVVVRETTKPATNVVIIPVK